MHRVFPDTSHLIQRARELNIGACPAGTITRFEVEIVADGLARDIVLPVLVGRGRRDGPVFGITAAVHGNELNGIRVIHDLFEHLEMGALRGTLVAVVAVNVPGLHAHQRLFSDGYDLNRLFPGRADGNPSQVFANRLIERIVRHFDYLIDLHTASFGRINSLYVRADMTHAKCARMAYLQRPQIIVHNAPSDRTLRGAAMDMGIPAITVEIGDPQRFQMNYIRTCRVGMRAVLADAGMLPRRAVAEREEPVICSRSYWMYTDRGGLLVVMPQPTDYVKKGELVARVRNAFGDTIREYFAPEEGIVVGSSANPVGQTGARILHLGIPAASDNEFLRREPLEPMSQRGAGLPPPSQDFDE